MSFDAVETSIRDATTLRLYDFNRLFKHWRYTSADRDVVIGGQTYKAVAISDDGRTLVFETYATNLVAGDTVDMPEVVAWRR